MRLLPIIAGIFLSGLLYGQPLIPLPRTLMSEPDTVSVVIGGDVMLHGRQIETARRPDGSFDFTPFLSRVQPYLEGADLCIVNMEFPLAGPPYSGYPAFSAPDAYAEYVAETGVDIFLAANNHIMDKGSRGAKRTLEAYRRMETSHGIRFTGLGDDGLLTVVRRGIRIALVNWTYGTNQSGDSHAPRVPVGTSEQITKLIRQAREQGVDFVIALPHWGVEYTHLHNAAQRSLALAAAQAGADAVIGSHPHVVQDSEVLTVSADNGIGVRKVPVWYSLGNVVSNMSLKGTRIGLLLELTLIKDRDRMTRRIDSVRPVFTWCTLPGNLTDSYCTVPVREWMDKREAWIRPDDYENMMRSYRSVKTLTGIEDEENH